MRDYDLEQIDNTRRYGYNFDYDVMHPLMIRAFEPFFHTDGNILELGSYEGAFTKRLLNYFSVITCVEPSDTAISKAKKIFGTNVNFIKSLIENLQYNKNFDNIILTHILEHVDNPIHVLKKIASLLSHRGRLFLVCPNANAPSRQIAAHMGLISHVEDVTEAERKHGHQRTYTLDSLEKEVQKAGLKVAVKTGIFFKALANFQWDQILEHKIISKEYIEGCYHLGRKYPDLCSSIFLLCEKS